MEELLGSVIELALEALLEVIPAFFDLLNTIWESWRTGKPREP